MLTIKLLPVRDGPALRQAGGLSSCTRGVVETRMKVNFKNEVKVFGKVNTSKVRSFGVKVGEFLASQCLQRRGRFFLIT